MRSNARLERACSPFPVTHFGADGAFDDMAYRAQYSGNLAHGPAACSSLRHR